MGYHPSFTYPSTTTKRFLDLKLSDIFPKEQIIVAISNLDKRSQLSLWDEIRKNKSRDILFISEKGKESIYVEDAAHSGITVSLRDQVAICKIFTASTLIDITGLSHHVWAPILKAAYSTKTYTRILYTEPDSYNAHQTPSSATLFDLSESIQGLFPLPGFAQLNEPIDEGKCLFVPMLGFEGNRPARLVSQIDPPPKVIPIIGVPGFQVEYPSYTVASNRLFLDEYRAFTDIRFARASCPFEIMSTLNDIRKDFPDYYIYIAPIGTKPHSLGAILYAIQQPYTTEIMYDNPVKKAGRTSGVGVVHIYDFGKFDAI